VGGKGKSSGVNANCYEELGGVVGRKEKGVYITKNMAKIFQGDGGQLENPS